MTQYLPITTIVFIGFNMGIITMWILQFLQSNKHFKKTQIDFELAVQEQRRNQTESDVTQLRIRKAEFKADNKFEGDVKDIICKRLKQYKDCRTPEIEKRIEELNKEKEEAGNCR